MISAFSWRESLSMIAAFSWIVAFFIREAFSWMENFSMIAAFSCIGSLLNASIVKDVLLRRPAPC